MKHTCKNKLFINKKQAFTLIELLIVIAIIGILFIVLVSKVDFATDKAKATGVQTDFRSFQMAFETVAREHAGFASLVDENYDKLEIAINKNLDNKLKIDIDDMGNITMANGAKDPWDVEYHGVYITGSDSKDRGAIVMYSNGANLTFGSEAAIAGGVVAISTTNGDGQDDYSIVACYSLANGYGEVKTSTSGFSNNQIIDNSTLNNGKQHANGLYFNRRYIAEAEGECIYFVFFEDGTGAMEMVGSRTPEVKFAYPFSAFGIQSIEYTETSIVMSASDLNQVVEAVVADDGQRLIIDGFAADFYLSDYYYYHYEGNYLSPDGFVYDKPYTMYYFDTNNTRFIGYTVLRQSGLWEVYCDYYDGNGPVLHSTGAANEVVSRYPIDSYDNGNYLVLHNNNGDVIYLMLEESIPFK